MKKLLLAHVNYNVWANQRISQMLSINKELLDKEVPSSFTSLRKTVFHIWDAEIIWLARLKGNSMEYFPSTQYEPETSIDKFPENSKEFAEFVESKDDVFLNTICHYKNTQKKEFSNFNYEIILHCMNHSTYHRGQLTTMLRNLGVTELITTDLIAYMREKKA